MSEQNTRDSQPASPGTQGDDSTPVTATVRDSAAPQRCRHDESLYGRCVHCGMTWEQQAARVTAWDADQDLPEPVGGWETVGEP